jgi:hypothetical protein
MNKYSTAATPATVNFLMNNGIAFVYRRGEHKQRYRVYFITDAETADAMMTETGFNIADENDGWDFNHWNAIKR